jgi:hypothetical protein
MSDDFNVELESVEAQGNDYDVVPEGKYEVQADTWEQSESKQGNKMLKVVFKILGPEYQNRLIFEYFVLNNQVALSRLKQWRIATGADGNDPLNGETIADQMQVPFSATVKVSKSTDDAYGDSNTISNFRPLEQSSAPSKAAEKSTADEGEDDSDMPF